VGASLRLPLVGVRVVGPAAVLVIAFPGPGVGGGPPRTAGTESHSALGFALLLAITSYVGFESASTVAREARNPFVTVTRAIRWTPLALGVLYTFAAAMQARGTVSTGIGSTPIVLTLPESPGTASTALSIVMELGSIASWR